ncbi:MAG: Qat anti-phage system QueC-like protein QatC [Afipia sp.]|nr:Qat anti-phage system QueC-like protein QatC [Afipia sp.]
MIGVHLFASGSSDLPGLGATLADRVRKQILGAPSVAAWDFMSIAMSVFAADRFVVRKGSPDGWTRVIGLDVALVDPAPWIAQASELSEALRFLTGDVWHLTFQAGGLARPQVQSRLHDRDAVCLFSGGLDSFLGALSAINSGARPLLVSQGSTKEIGPQQRLATALGLDAHRFEGRVAERWRQPYEGSTRARSILFFAYGALAATGCGIREVLVPENALIAINPPFTDRRIGSLSTRTTHPHFMSRLNDIWAATGVQAELRNPFFATTKGEMLAQGHHPRLAELAAGTYSCGKGKRANGQCGRCVPCLIRRASFHTAGLPDGTLYLNDLRASSRNDDVLAARHAVAAHYGNTPRDLGRWVARAGPLPADAATRARTIGAVGRGMAELGALFGTVRWR